MANDDQKPTAKPTDHLTQQGIHLSDETVDVANADWDESLSRVWVSETTGELCASMDRLIFETPLTTAVRFMEPHGFNLNFENLLACLDSMKFVVFAKTSGVKPNQPKEIAKKIAPAVFLKLPQRSAKGPLLARFYEEIGKYESELSRLQQYEAQSRKAVQEAIKDESGRSAIAQVQRDNELLREEVNRLSRRVAQLNSAIESVPLQNRDSMLPPGVKLCQVRQVKEHENLVHFKSDAGQYSFPLSKLQGVPAVGARAMSMHEGGQVRGVWVFDPEPTPFQDSVATVLYEQAGRIKVRGEDRIDRVLDLPPGGVAPKRGDKLLLKMAGGYVITWTALTQTSFDDLTAEIFDAQTTRELRQTNDDFDRVVVRESNSSSKSKPRRKGRAA